MFDCGRMVSRPLKNYLGCRYGSRLAFSAVYWLLNSSRKRLENPMPWYAWLIILLAFGSIVSGLVLLRDSAKPLPLTDEQLRLIHARNAQADAKEDEPR
jgi:hypothetical protein